MNDNAHKKEKIPEIMILERRKERAELSSAEVMKILRKRARVAGRSPEVEVPWDGK